MSQNVTKTWRTDKQTELAWFKVDRSTTLSSVIRNCISYQDDIFFFCSNVQFLIIFVTNLLILTVGVFLLLIVDGNERFQDLCFFTNDSIDFTYFYNVKRLFFFIYIGWKFFQAFSDPDY